jgi:hypothetical protein
MVPLLKEVTTSRTPRGPYVPVRSDLAESETLVESEGVGDVEVEVAAAMASIEPGLSLKTIFN